MNTVDKILSEGIDSVTEDEYREFILRASENLEDQNLVKKDWDEFVTVGDTHGDLEAAKIPVEFAVKKGLPIVFLGDYVDRGSKQLENLAYVLGLKIQRPDKTVLLRGNHETEDMNRRYGFYDVLKRIFSLRIYDEIMDLYEKLPLASAIDGSYFLVHGGIAEGVSELREINELDHRDEKYKEFYWNDPSEDIDKFKMNYLRGGYKLYGRKALDEFLRKNDLDMLIRAHQCFEPGYKYFFDKKLLSIFSVPEYRGNPEGKFALVSEDEVRLKDVKY